MNMNRYLLASLAAAVWLLMYGFVVNTIILADFWSAQPVTGLMRPEGEEIMWAIVMSCLLQGLALGMIFVRWRNGPGVGDGLKFGLLTAWFVAAVYLLFYGLQPWDVASTAVSIGADSVMYIGAGLILALVYRP